MSFFSLSMSVRVREGRPGMDGERSGMFRFYVCTCLILIPLRTNLYPILFYTHTLSRNFEGGEMGLI